MTLANSMTLANFERAVLVGGRLGENDGAWFPRWLRRRQKRRQVQLRDKSVPFAMFSCDPYGNLIDQTNTHWVM